MPLGSSLLKGLKRLRYLLENTLPQPMPVMFYLEKLRWEKLAKENPNFYVYSKHVSKEEFWNSRKVDYELFISRDALLNSVLLPFSEKTMLEVGGGVGRMTKYFAENFGMIVSLDVSWRMLELARKNLRDYRNVVFIELKTPSIPLPSESFDFTFSYAVFQHMRRKMVESMFREVQRVLVPGGIFKAQLRGAPAASSAWYFGDFWTEKDIHTLSSSAGFEIEKVLVRGNYGLC